MNWDKFCVSMISAMSFISTIALLLFLVVLVGCSPIKPYIPAL
jgi:hypothetical protein